MQRTFKILELELYTYWASALINGDDSGLEPDELEELAYFNRRMRKDYPKGFGCVDVSEDSYFGEPEYRYVRNPLRGDVATFIFHIYK